MYSQNSHEAKVKIVPGKLSEFFSWCQDNCKDSWVVNPYLPDPDVYKFYFESEQDYIAFVLWKTDD